MWLFEEPRNRGDLDHASEDHINVMPLSVTSIVSKGKNVSIAQVINQTFSVHNIIWHNASLLANSPFASTSRLRTHGEANSASKRYLNGRNSSSYVGSICVVFRVLCLCQFPEVLMLLVALCI